MVERQNLDSRVKLKENTREIDLKKECEKETERGTEAEPSCLLCLPAVKFLHCLFFPSLPLLGQYTLRNKPLSVSLKHTHTHTHIYKVRKTTDPLWNNRSEVSWQGWTSLICTFC
ncbi:hypothetical protein GOODEAATRI_000992 [Goodea atripinnis]|uniref:Uncharacterized protein n=1 Tax=Goodea atripinnis TaxID=208336 RepID=A0ABV0PJY6_9TELE